MASHTLLSEKNVQDCIEEAERLTALRDQRLRDLIGVMKEEIRHLAVELTYSDGQIASILRECQHDDPVDTFNNYEAQLIRIKKDHVAATPIIELIKQRDDVLRECPKQSASPTEPPLPPKEESPAEKEPGPRKKLPLKDVHPPKKDPLRQRPPDATEKLKEARAARLFNFILPRLNSKLKALLIQFADQQGEDFIWKGKRLLDELADVEAATLTRHPPQGTKFTTSSKPPPPSRTQAVGLGLPTASLFSQSRAPSGRTGLASFRT
jgi:hypothetical protein